MDVEDTSFSKLKKFFTGKLAGNTQCLKETRVLPAFYFVWKQRFIFIVKRMLLGIGEKT